MPGVLMDAIILAVLCRYDHHCLVGFKNIKKHGFVSAFLFSTETQQTIGMFLHHIQTRFFCQLGSLRYGNHLDASLQTNGASQKMGKIDASGQLP